MYLIFDIETTDYPKMAAPISTQTTGPRCINRLATARRNGKSYRASRLFGQPEGFIPYDAERISRNFYRISTTRRNFIARSLEKFNIALSKPNIVGQNVGFWT
jgi:hypothetical protein